MCKADKHERMQQKPKNTLPKTGPETATTSVSNTVRTSHVLVKKLGLQGAHQHILGMHGVRIAS